DNTGDNEFSPLPNTRDINTPTLEDIAQGIDGEVVTETDVMNWRAPIIEAIRSQAEKANICPELLNYATKSALINENVIQELVNSDLLRLLPPVKSRGNGKIGQVRRVPQTSRAKRRADYARIQSLYKTSKTGCAKVVLEGKWNDPAPTLPMDEQLQFWKPLFETPSIEDSRDPPDGIVPHWGMVAPILTEEVIKHLVGMKDGAAGPDHRR
ncbi:MAG: hypothetical protein M3H12_03530, partial [Chromatiales bacterium]